jgi:hypothetical protein
MDATVDRDGYLIHYSVVGAGPRVVWVDPALGSSTMRPLQAGVEALAQHFEVVTYDRRGRGRNAPAADLSAAAEVADLRALTDHLGGASAVLGFSSGAGLALHAAPGLRAGAVVLLEPAVDAGPDRSGLGERIGDALARGDHEGAVLAFYDAVGVPADAVRELAGSDLWAEVVRCAPTLPADLDLAVVGDDAVAAVDLPAHVVVSTGSPEEIVEMGERVARRLGARLWREAGGWHDVEASALAARLTTLLAA